MLTWKEFVQCTDGEVVPFSMCPLGVRLVHWPYCSCRPDCELQSDEKPEHDGYKLFLSIFVRIIKISLVLMPRAQRSPSLNRVKKEAVTKRARTAIWLPLFRQKFSCFNFGAASCVFAGRISPNFVCPNLIDYICWANFSEWKCKVPKTHEILIFQVIQ